MSMRDPVKIEVQTSYKRTLADKSAKPVLMRYWSKGGHWPPKSRNDPWRQLEQFA